MDFIRGQLDVGRAVAPQARQDVIRVVGVGQRVQRGRQRGQRGGQ